MINADFSWIIRVYHNHLRHQLSLVFVVYFCRFTLMPSSALSGAHGAPYSEAICTPNSVNKAKSLQRSAASTMSVLIECVQS